MKENIFKITIYSLTISLEITFLVLTILRYISLIHLIIIFYLSVLMIFVIESHLRIRHDIDAKQSEQREFNSKIRESNSKLRDTIKNCYRQTESLFSLFSSIDIEGYLPPLREMAISPDMANIIVSLIKENKPSFILELGSGASTIIGAYALKKNGIGKIISLDQKEEYQKETEENIIKNNLQNLAEIFYCPLKEYTIDNKQWDWYDISKITLPEIDMLIVDGPIQDSQSMMKRYPALPVLFQSIKKGGIIVLDDASREHEKNIISEWIKGFEVEYKFVNTEKGTAIFTKK